MLLDAGIGESQYLEAASALAHGFGPILRSLVDLDRNAVAEGSGDCLG